jgi:hypothetical protein
LTLKSLATVNDAEPHATASLPNFFQPPTLGSHPSRIFETHGHLRVFRGGREF